MQLKNKILSYFLLATYLLVVLHQSVSHSHASEFDGTLRPKSSHTHNHFKDVHHEHHFHVGIFHFLGHLFESISHANDNAEDHLAIIQNTSTKKVTDHKSPISKVYNINNLVLIEVGAESLPDPPYYQIPYLQKLTRSTSPLRAPPFFV